MKREEFFGELPTAENMEECRFDYPGVWALFGKRISETDKKWYCLQVASTECIQKEMEADKQLMDDTFDACIRKKQYVNQFGEKVFSFFEYPTAREYLYGKYIKEQFKDFKFVVICKEEDGKRRKMVEKKFAYHTKAVYWRNGHPYEDGEVIDYTHRKKNSLELFHKDEVTDPDTLNKFIHSYHNQNQSKEAKARQAYRKGIDT